MSPYRILTDYHPSKQTRNWHYATVDLVRRLMLTSMLLAVKSLTVNLC